MKNILYISLVCASSVLLSGCMDSEDELRAELLTNVDSGEIDPIDPGTADFTKYVAIGNSLTAGFSDGALYPQSQANSYPAILATQLSLAGGGVFNQPNISSGNGYGGGAPGSEVGKGLIDVGAALVNPANAIQFTSGSPLTANSVSNLNNFGVPLARIVDATNPLYGYPGAGNPFFAAFASTPGGSSMLDDAIAANPTFFSVWLGNNDVLRYATGGGADEGLITSQGDFQTALVTILGGLSAGGAKGVVLNIPPVHLAPYFQIATTLSGGVKVLPAGSIDVATAGFLNSAAAYGEYDSGLGAAVLVGAITQAEADMRAISFTGDVANAPVITDESLTTADISAAFGAPAGSVILPNIRQAQVNAATGQYDLFPLMALSVLGTLADPTNPTTVYGVGVPLPDPYTLTMAEQVNVITAYATFNATISGVLQNFPNVNLVDVGPMFADMFGLSAAQAAGLQLSAAAQAAADGELGIQIGGYDLVPLSLEACCLFNSVWSADGLHTNARGAAIIANEIIKVINSAHNIKLPEVDVLNYTGINAKLP